ncbi:hypothetical protein EAF04_005123 [Stromatinia cepivora]|nr:hypothetical protein EAF04_005123 [Stromatinia cepivora]
MAPINNTQDLTPTTPEPKLQTTPINFTAQSRISGVPPRTPPNARKISPPRAPRPRRVLRTEGMWTRNAEPSTLTPSRLLKNIGGRSVTPEVHYQSNRERDTRSVSPSENRSRSYRARSPLLNYPRSRSLARAAPQLLPSAFIDEGAIPTNNHSPGRFDVGMQYMNMLSIADPHQKEEMAADVSLGLQGDENADSNLEESNLNAYDKTEEEKNEKEHDIWPWKF